MADTPGTGKPNKEVNSRELTRPERVSSEQLLGAAQELIIVHGGREYRLRRTQSGRLILTA